MALGDLKAKIAAREPFFEILLYMNTHVEDAARLRAVLAAGALERPVAFQNNDRPGIMTAGAVRAYLNRWGVSPGRSVTVFGNNDDAHRTARDL